MTVVVYVTGHASCQWPAWPCPRREVTGQSTVTVTRSWLLQRVQRSEGECNAGRCRGQINVLTGTVLKKARARAWTSDISLYAVLSFTGNAGSNLIMSVWFSIIWTCSKSLLTASVWSAGRRSKGDNRIRWSRSSPL